LAQRSLKPSHISEPDAAPALLPPLQKGSAQPAVILLTGTAGFHPTLQSPGENTQG